MKNFPLPTRLLLSLVLVASVPAQAQEVTLKITHFLPGEALTQRGVLEPWCADLGKQSAGRIKCQFYPAMQLGGSPAQLIDQVKDGIADVAWTAPGYAAGRFPQTEVLELPGVLPMGGLAGGRVIWDFYQSKLTHEYAAYKVLAMHGDGGMNLHTVKKPINSAADLVGLKLRSPNRTISKTLQALGVTPVGMPASQMIEAITKGVVDGASAVWEVMRPTKLDEVTYFHMETPADKPVLGATVLVLLMNKQKYDALPADLKSIIDRNSGLPLVERYGRVWDEAAVAARDKVKAAKHTVTMVSGAAYDEMRKRVEPVEKDWIADSKSKGFNGEALLAAARATARKPQ